MVEKLLGKGASSMPNYNGDLQELLAETVFIGNSGVADECKIPPRLHNLVRRITGDEKPTNERALGLYLKGVEKLHGIGGRRLYGLGEKGINQLEKYLCAIGILQAPLASR